MINPDQYKCAVPSGGCPDGFATMSSQNFTNPRCVPESLEDVKIAEREREVDDKNRCAEGYKLNVPEGTDIFRTGSPIGSCAKIH